MSFSSKEFLLEGGSLEKEKENQTKQKKNSNKSWLDNVLSSRRY